MPEELEQILKLVFVYVGLGGFLYTVYSILMALLSKSWVPVSGTITEHGMNETRDSDGDYMYEAKVQYTYEYRNRPYKGERIAYGFGSWNIKWFVEGAYREVVARAPELTVYVNPRKPKISSALCGVRNFHVATLIFFIVWNLAVLKIF